MLNTIHKLYNLLEVEGWFCVGQDVLVKDNWIFAEFSLGGMETTKLRSSMFLVVLALPPKRGVKTPCQVTCI